VHAIIVNTHSQVYFPQWYLSL